jgi:hypothetical protein
MNKKNYEVVVFNIQYVKDDIVTTSNATSVKQDSYFEGESMDDIFE